MAIVAKFKVDSVTNHDGGNEQVKLSAAHGSGNESWAKFTPFGSLDISITNPEAQKQLIPGKHYLLTFTEAVEA